MPGRSIYFYPTSKSRLSPAAKRQQYLLHKCLPIRFNYNLLTNILVSNISQLPILPPIPSIVPIRYTIKYVTFVTMQNNSENQG